MIKYPKSSEFLSKVHRFGVNTAIGVSAATLVIIGVNVYQYFTIVRPERQQQQSARQASDQQLSN